MPQLIPMAIAAITGLAVTSTAVAVISAVVVVMGSLALSHYQKRKAERAARAEFDASQVDRLANVPSTVAPRELVLGKVRKGGHVFFRGSTGIFKETFVSCIALAAHEIDDVEQIYFNGEPIDVDGSGNVLTAPFARFFTETAGQQMFTTTATLPANYTPGSAFVVRTKVGGSQADAINESVPYSISGSTLSIDTPDLTFTYTLGYQTTTLFSLAVIRWYLGAPGQASDARLQQLFPGVWTPAHRADGIAYLICEFRYDETAMPSGLPNVTARIRGAKVYDPRSGLTAFTENPALMMRHVILHPQFGKRTSVSAAEDARLVAAANACDTAINYGTGSVAMYRAATVMPFGATARDALDDLAQAMGGQWAYAAGEFFARAGVYQAPVLALGDADLAVVQRAGDGSTSQNPITISTHRPRNDKINTVVARIWDQAAGYVQTPIAPYRSDALVAADGAELLQEVTMPAVFYAAQAYHVAGIMLRDSRDPLTVTLPFKLTAYPVQLFDSVTLTLARYGWVAKEFQVLGRTFLADGVVQLTLKETAAAIYQYGAGFVPSGYASNSVLPKPWEIAPPVLTSVSSGTSELIVQSDGTIVTGVRVTWALVPDMTVQSGGNVELQYMVWPDGAWRSITVPGGDTQGVFSGVPDGVVIVIRARSRNSLAVSDWGTQWWHAVIGKTEPPPNIEEMTISGSVLSWNLPRRVPDLAGFIFRFHYGNNLDWGSATPLHTGVITQSPYDLATRPSGVVTIMGKALDTTGNESPATANIVMDLGDQTIANIVATWDFQVLGWPYSAADSSGWTLVLGNPSANSLDSFYGTDDQSFYGTDTTPFYEASAYGQMVYVTNEVAVSAALSGSLMTLDINAQGVDLRIEYRLSGPTSFYGPDGASLYGADADPLYGPPGAWQPWPGQMVAANDVYQFRVTIGAGATQGILQSMLLTIDAPDMNEAIANLPVSAAGTVIPFTKPFSVIKVVNATLQANGSGAVTVEIDKSVALAPSIKAYNAAHTAVSGATVDILIQGY
ncbi:phage tail protein [Variovorax saccharolyticus]|uniref:phage tail protein n=1 Tax=Variovorax saccharolyticus TaxID=3053516 RepID=UPI0025769229|nr:phage tail protein [Variovorax sp. J31P216]MDM0024069.1 phage tail protein [Variovorax sp. J31P216]